MTIGTSVGKSFEDDFEYTLDKHGLSGEASDGSDRSLNKDVPPAASYKLASNDTSVEGLFLRTVPVGEASDNMAEMYWTLRTDGGMSREEATKYMKEHSYDTREGEGHWTPEEVEKYMRQQPQSSLARQKYAMADEETLGGKVIRPNFPAVGSRPSEGAAKGPAEVIQSPTSFTPNERILYEALRDSYLQRPSLSRENIEIMNKGGWTNSEISKVKQRLDIEVSKQSKSKENLPDPYEAALKEQRRDKRTEYEKLSPANQAHWRKYVTDPEVRKTLGIPDSADILPLK